MSDLLTSCKTTYHGNDRNWLNDVKLSKCELPFSISRSYWNEVFAEIEKKYKRVRDPYPSLFLPSKPSTVSVRTLLTNNIKVKILPPKSIHETKKFSINSITNKTNKNSLIIKDVTKNNNQQKKKLKLPLVIPKNIKTLAFDAYNESNKESKISYKKCCPYHKNSSSRKVLDEKIFHHLQKIENFLPELKLSKKNLCHHHKQICNRNEAFKRNISKMPKICKASFLPSCAKTILIKSSCVAEEYFDAEAKFSKFKSQNDNSYIEIKKKDFLRIPNLKFVSSQPSFRNLSLVDSFEKEYTYPENTSIISNEEFLIEKKSLKPKKNNLTFKTDFINETEKLSEMKKLNRFKVNTSVENVIEKMSYYEKKYIYKALNRITKQKHFQRYIQNTIFSPKTSLSSEESIKCKITKNKNKKLKRLKKNESINFKEIHEKLKDLSNKYLSDNRKFKLTSVKLDKSKSITIYSSSQSISGPNTNLESSITMSSDNILKEIPKARLFHRPYIDKCFACLHKSFNYQSKTTREQPTSIIKYNIPNIFNFNDSSSSSSNISIINKINKCLKYDPNNTNISDYSKIEKNLLNSSVNFLSQNFKNKSEESFDRRNLSPITQSNIETSSPVEKISSPQLLPNYQLKDKSLSIQSSDRSKTSTLSNVSSDSEEMGFQEDNLPRSKFSAPCHAPVVWCPSLEPLRALKSKKSISLNARAAAITTKSSNDSDSDGYNIDIIPNRLQARKQEQVALTENTKDVNKITKKKPKIQKSLVRINSASNKITTFSSSVDIKEIKKKKLLKRAKTIFDLRSITSELKYENSEEEENNSVRAASISEYENENKNLPYSDVITLHRARSPPTMIMSTEDVTNVIQECLKTDFSASNLMKKLNNEFIKRMEDKCKTIENYESKKYLKLGLNLFKLLVDSKQYIQSNTFDPDLEFSQKQPPVINSRQLRRILPEKSYDLVASVLGIPKYFVKTDANRVSQPKYGSSKTDTEESELTFDLIVHPGTSHDSIENCRRFHGDRFNPYAIFLRKPRRKVVIWRPLRKEDLIDYDPEATLKMRAARLMTRICQEFCEWLNKLGDTVQMIDVDTLQDMFEINFTSDICESTQITLKEMPTIPTAVVEARNCSDANELTNTRKQIKKDLKIEKYSKHTFAFGQTLPREFRFVPPQNKVASKWLDCENIPKDVESMDVVWKGIMHLDSVQTFMKYLKENPEVASQKLCKNINQRPIAKAI